MAYSTYAPTAKAVVYPMLRTSVAAELNEPRILRNKYIRTKITFINELLYNMTCRSSDISAANKIAPESVPAPIKPQRNRDANSGYVDVADIISSQVI